MTVRVSSRGYEVAEKIRDRVGFQTHGALNGEEWPLVTRWHSGRLAGDDLLAFYATIENSVIDYIVWSYNTPIAWHTPDGQWYKVAQKFSPTTSAHQGRLYLAGQS
jgi:hypothetical protein